MYTHKKKKFGLLDCRQFILVTSGVVHTYIVLKRRVEVEWSGDVGDRRTRNELSCFATRNLLASWCRVTLVPVLFNSFLRFLCSTRVSQCFVRLSSRSFSRVLREIHVPIRSEGRIRIDTPGPG